MAMPAMQAWTLADLERMPDDGNKYEVVRGELFVTPAPSYWHQLIVTRLARILDPYVVEQQLGMVFQARSIVRRRGSESEPDLFVSDVATLKDWNEAPTPSLVVEVESRSTRRRDLNEKRAYYIEDAGIAEYWMVDRESRSIRVARPGHPDSVVTGRLVWHPAGASRPLEFEVAPLFA